MTDEPTIWISGRLVEKIRAHGAETYPHECCGALLGRDSGVVAGSDPNKDGLNAEREIHELFPLVNRRDDSPHNRFSVTADDVRAAEKAARVQKGAPQDMTSWRLTEDREGFSPEGIEIRHRAAV